MNGFVVFEADPNSVSGSRSTTRWLTPNVIAGNNVIEISYLAHQEADENSHIKLKISSAVHGAARSTGTVLMEERIGSESLSIETLDPNNLTMLNGSIDENGKLVFDPNNVLEDGCAWRVHFNSDVIKLRPTHLDYTALSKSLESGRVRFEKGQIYPLGGAAAADYVEFSFDELPRGYELFELGDPISSSGANTDFDTFTIYGQVDGGTDPGNPVTCSNFQINQILREDVEKTLTLSLGTGTVPTWSWQNAADISTISQPQEDELWDAIVSIHSTMNNATDPNELLPLFTKKTLDYASAMYVSNAEMEQNQLSFFESLLADSNWGMKAISREDFKYFNVNSKIIKVERLNGSELFETNILQSGPANNRSLEIPLYFALISDEWKIVQ